MRCGLKEGGRRGEGGGMESELVICYLDERGGTRGGGELFNELIIARCLEPRW